MIYLDYASSTPIDKNVLKLMSLYQSKYFANPSSIHGGGAKVRKLIEQSRESIADAIFAHSDEIIFTGSGTESISLAILGYINSYKGNSLPHIITTVIEHSAVIENCKMLEKNNQAEVTYVMPDENGLINPKDIRDALKENTVLVSVMYANNEIGTIEPIQEIAKVIRHFRKSKTGKEALSGHGEFSGENSPQTFASSGSRAPDSASFPLFHTDACQAMNYLETSNIEKLGVDLLSFNSSKIYGPKGIAVLYKKRGVTLTPLYIGGGQESGLRSGTEDVASIVGIAKALEVTNKIKIKESARLATLRDYGIKKIIELNETSGYQIVLNGEKSNRLPNNINISVFGISSELLVIELDSYGIEVSAKSACKSDEPDESYVISAIRKAQGLQSNTTDGSIRISLGRETKKSDIDVLVKSLKEILAKYKKWK